MLTIGAFSAITYTSCNKDKCKDVVCSNGGTCLDGICTCKSGYEGTTCATVSAAKFVGTYSVVENCSVSGGVGPYTTTIVESTTNEVNILMNDFGDLTATITIVGSVNGTTLTIASQTVSGYTVSGSGTYNNGVITITYTIASTNSETCTATWTKQ